MRQDWELDIFLWGRNNFRNLIIYSLLYNQHRRSIWLCTSAHNYGHSVESSTSWSISYWYPWWLLMFGRVSPYLSPHWTCRCQMDPRVGGGCCDTDSYIYYYNNSMSSSSTESDSCGESKSSSTSLQLNKQFLSYTTANQVERESEINKLLSASLLELSTPYPNNVANDPNNLENRANI